MWQRVGRGAEGAYRIFFGNLSERDNLEDQGIDRTILKCTFKKQNRGRGLDWSGSCREKCWALLNPVGELWVQNAWNMTSRGTVSFSKGNLFHMVNYAWVLAPCTIVGLFQHFKNWATYTFRVTECGVGTFRWSTKLLILHGVRTHKTNIWGTGK